MMANIKDIAEEWLRLDRDHKTHSVIQQLLAQQDFVELEILLRTRLEFGTAGLRAQMGAGFSRLNQLTIIQTSQGLGEYLLREGISAGGVVIGYDARHNSKKFAELAAAAFMVKGIPVWWYEDTVHTPMVPFGVKTFKAAAGVMITASHNPKEDNGYKVYGSNGCQINNPVDSHIAGSILENLEPITWSFEASSALLKSIRGPATQKYCDAVSEFVGQFSTETYSVPAFVYTPMHGVGYKPMKELMQKFGHLKNMTLVPEQNDPDPDFPTVKYPNPEEDGALDLAEATADNQGVTFILANDPDADRFAVAEKVDGHWRQFTGDQVGTLFAHFLQEHRSAGKGDDYMLTTAVSSQMLSVMASKTTTPGETLTGFKWLGNRALDLEHQGRTVLFAYEEALGYMFPTIVHDKDGITAAVVFLCACAEWGSPWAQLQRLYERYGYFETMNTYWKSPDHTVTSTVFQRIRGLGAPYPTQVAGSKVIRWRDLTLGFDSSTQDHLPELPSSPCSQMITCWLESVRFTIRASGTEPKIKIYLECPNKDQEVARADALTVLKRISSEWFGDPKLVIEQKYAYLASAL